MSSTAAARAQTIPPGEPDAEQHRHVVSALVVDRPGTLNRVAGLLRARSFNIESLTVGASEKPGASRMTIVVQGDEGHLRQVLAQLERLIEVLEVADLHGTRHVELELALATVTPPSIEAEATALDAAVASAGGTWLERGASAWFARLVASPAEIDRAIAALGGLGLQTLVRAGAVALATPGGPSTDPLAENGVPRP